MPIRTFCTNKTVEVTTGVFEVDTVLLRGRHDRIIESYTYTYDSSEVDTGNALNVVVDTTSGQDVLRFKNEAERVKSILPEARGKNKEIRDKYLLQGLVTTVLDAEGNPIKMDCKRTDGENLSYLVGHLQETLGLPDSYETVVTDYNNVKHVLPISSIKQIFTEMRANGLKAFSDKWEREALLENATTLAEVNGILGTDYQ